MKYILTIILLLLAASAWGQTYRFGDSLQSSYGIIGDDNLKLVKLAAPAYSGTLDSMRIFFASSGTGTDTIVAAIYDSDGDLLGRSNDSSLSVAGEFSTELAHRLHFSGQDIAITASATYWVGIHVRVGASAANAMQAAQSATDTTWVFITDALPLAATLSGGVKYIGAAQVDERCPIRITVYYTAGGSAPADTANSLYRKTSTRKGTYR
jgi:hypothetical protein